MPRALVFLEGDGEEDDKGIATGGNSSKGASDATSKAAPATTPRALGTLDARTEKRTYSRIACKAAARAASLLAAAAPASSREAAEEEEEEKEGEEGEDGEAGEETEIVPEEG